MASVGPRVEAEFISRLPFFDSLQPAVLADLMPSIQVRRHPPGRMMLMEEDPVGSLFILREGRLKMSRFLHDGKEVIFGLKQAPDLFGEVELFQKTGSVFSVTAISAVVIYMLPERPFRRLMQIPDCARAFGRLLSRRCRDAWHQAEVLAVNDGDTRVRIALYQLSQKKASPARKQATGFRVTHQQLSGLTGVTRETVSRVLGRLQRARLVEAEGRGLLIREPDRLLDALLIG